MEHKMDTQKSEKSLERGLINLIIDLQWGSTGKGAISRYLAEKEEVQVAICHFSPNSAHTSVEADGTKNIVKQLPQAAALVARGADIELMIGADACINPAVLDKELNEYKGASEKLVIHPNAVMITQECIDEEAATLVRISSTLQGTAFAKAHKLTRNPKAILAKDHPLTKPFVDKNFNKRLIGHMAESRMILGDFHQGYELSVNSQFYPFVTSSTVNTSSFLASLNLPPSAIGTVIGTARSMPIRVGNVKDAEGKVIGYSGDVYEDQKELTWEGVQQISGSEKSMIEHTTLTNKVRRIFTFSHKAMRDAVAANDVDYLYLNFVNYLDATCYAKGTLEELAKHPKVMDFIDQVQKQCLVKIKWVGTGPQNDHIIEL